MCPSWLHQSHKQYLAARDNAICALAYLHPCRLLPALQTMASWKEVRDDGLGGLALTDVPPVMLATLDYCGDGSAGGGGGEKARAFNATSAAAAKLVLKTASLNVTAWAAEYQATTTTEQQGTGQNDGGAGISAGNETYESSLSLVRGNADTACTTRVPVTLFLGLPGSGVLSLAAAVLQFSSGEIDWAPAVVVAAVGEGINELELHNAIG